MLTEVLLCVWQVGTVTPIEDFQDLISRKEEDLFEKGSVPHPAWPHSLCCAGLVLDQAWELSSDPLISDVF